MGAKDSKTKAVDTMTSGQKKLLDQLTTLLQGELGKSSNVYGGEIAPGSNQLLDQMFSGLQGLPDAWNQYTSGQPAFEVDPAAREKVYAAEKEMAYQDYDDFTRIAAEKMNMKGGGRSGALGRSFSRGAARLTTGLNQTYANLGYKDEEARRAAAESGANRGLAGLQGQQGAYGALGLGGDMMRQIQGQQNNEEYNRWLQAQPAYNQWMQYLPMAFGAQASTPGVFTEDKGLLGSILPGGAMGGVASGGVSFIPGGPGG